MRTLLSAVLIRLTLVRALRGMLEQGTSFGQLQGIMLRGDVFSARGG